MQANIDNNSLPTPKSLSKKQFYNFTTVRAYYSISFTSINSILSSDLKTLNNVRHAWTVLLHLNAYSKCLKTSISGLFKIRANIIDDIINEMTRLGYIREVSQKTRGNIGFLVKRTAYMITPLGKQVASQLDDLLSAQVAKLRK